MAEILHAVGRSHVANYSCEKFSSTP